MPQFDSNAFQMLYTGVLTERGQMDLKALVEETLAPDIPGLGHRLLVAEDMVHYNEHKDILSIPCFGATTTSS